MGKGETQQTDEKKSSTSAVKVKFDSTLPRHNRVITAADFKRVGVDHGKIDVLGGEVVEVSSEAADYLVDTLGEFSRADDDTESKPVEAQMTDEELNQQLQDQNPAAGGGASQVGSNVRDGAGARSATINR